jgi:hypothetical protein
MIFACRVVLRLRAFHWRDDIPILRLTATSVGSIAALKETAAYNGKNDIRPGNGFVPGVRKLPGQRRRLDWKDCSYRRKRLEIPDQTEAYAGISARYDLLDPVILADTKVLSAFQRKYRHILRRFADRLHTCVIDVFDIDNQYRLEIIVQDSGVVKGKGRGEGIHGKDTDTRGIVGGAWGSFSRRDIDGRNCMVSRISPGIGVGVELSDERDVQ